MKKKKFNAGGMVTFLIYLLAGAVCGLAVTRLDMNILLSVGLVLVLVLLSMYLHVLLHEAGHLVFGLMSGYRFLSFRIGSRMWTKEDGKLRQKRLSIPGTGGQCLLAPPDYQEGQMTFLLYNLGGTLMNIITGLLCVGLSFLPAGDGLPSAVLLIFGVIGLAIGLINGLPLEFKSVANDGYNALALKKDPAARRAFWLQMKMSEQLAAGLRQRDMPEEWFTPPSEEEMKNGLTAAIGVLSCGRLMDEHRFEEAKSRIRAYLEGDTAILGMHQGLLVCDLIYCELLGNFRARDVYELYGAEEEKFMKSMSAFPSVIRTRYAIALLFDHDLEAAEDLREQFEKAAKSYPYSGDIESERELIAIAEERSYRAKK